MVRSIVLAAILLTAHVAAAQQTTASASGASTSATAQPTAATTPRQPKSNYQPLRERTRSRGSISNRGISSVNAIETPLGRYQKMVYDAIGTRWYALVTKKMNLISLGTTHVVFSIDRTGRVRNPKIVSNSSNETFANVCLQSIIEIQLPPIPEAVASTLPPEGLDEKITFNMFPNEQPHRRTAAQQSVTPQPELRAPIIGGQANQLLTYATLAYSAGEYDRAIDLVDSALAVLKPDKAAPALLFRGRAYLKKGELDKAERDSNEVTDLDPKQYAAYIERAIIYNRKKDQARALRELDSISALKRNKPGSALNGVAWIRATFPEPGLRDGNKATQEALRACEESQWQESDYIDTLAAAYAETGDFERAVKFQEQALGMVGPENPRQQKMESRLALYRDHKPYREDPLDQ
jgi:tetratricopeptide (TPR) repeat protein